MSHGSKSNNIGVWAMAQSSIIFGIEPRKGNFVAIFEVIKALQFWCFFTLYIYSTHYQNINVSILKGIRLGLIFSNQISLVTLRSLFTISGQTKFLIPSPVYILPCTFLFIIFIMDHPVQSNNMLLVKNDDVHNYMHTFEYFERKDKIGLWSWLKPSKNRTFRLGSNT